MSTEQHERFRLDEIRGVASPTPDPERFRFEVRTAPEVMAIPDPPDSYLLLGPYVCRGARTILVGDSGHGKTSLGLQMLAAIVQGEPMLGYDGAGVGPVLVLDLEQGVRSIKRGLAEAQLGERDDVLVISQPDGLALDQDVAHLDEVDRVLAKFRPAVVLLDPYYKAHRSDDPNAERPIIDLMRRLDRFRVEYGFALILPAHPRKDVVGREGARKLTLHDVAGSGAVTRGAEIVLGLERLGHGYARLRYLKDRDGDLPVGEAVGLLYSKAEGFKLDPRDETPDAEIVEAILAEAPEWRTTREWATLVKGRHSRVKEILANLAETSPERVRYAVGPPGRSAKAQCYSTVPEGWEQSGTLTLDLLDTESTVPTAPPLGGARVGNSPTSAREHENSGGNSALSDPSDNPFNFG